MISLVRSASLIMECFREMSFSTFLGNPGDRQSPRFIDNAGHQSNVVSANAAAVKNHGYWITAAISEKNSGRAVVTQMGCEGRMWFSSAGAIEQKHAV